MFRVSKHIYIVASHHNPIIRYRLHLARIPLKKTFRFYNILMRYIS